MPRGHGCTDAEPGPTGGLGCAVDELLRRVGGVFTVESALLTGRYPGNAGVRAILGGHRTASGLSPEVPTLATALRPLGYRTSMVGKWHLGAAEECRPHRHGFDSWYGFLAGCVDYYSHIYYWGSGTNPVHDLWSDGEEVFDNGRYLTELITDRTVAEIRASARAMRPFFIYTAYNAPHYPMHAPRRYLDRFPDLPPDRRIMAAMLSAVDDGIGEILGELERWGLREDTIIVFCSDHGPSRESRNWLDGTPDPYYGGSSGRLKGNKFSLFEGGIRVPGVVSWPAWIPAAQVSDQPCCGIDIFPTILTAAGGDVAPYEIDGLNMLPVLSSGAPGLNRLLFFELGKQTALRQGRWKLVLHGQLVEDAPVEDDVFLADLDTDPGERHNLAATRPELVAELTSAALAWRQQIETRWHEQWAPAIPSA